MSLVLFELGLASTGRTDWRANGQNQWCVLLGPTY